MLGCRFGRVRDDVPLELFEEAAELAEVLHKAPESGSVVIACRGLLAFESRELGVHDRLHSFGGVGYPAGLPVAQDRGDGTAVSFGAYDAAGGSSYV